MLSPVIARWPSPLVGSLAWGRVPRGAVCATTQPSSSVTFPFFFFLLLLSLSLFRDIGFLNSFSSLSSALPHSVLCP